MPIAMSEYAEKSKYICNAFKRANIYPVTMDISSDTCGTCESALPHIFAINTFLPSPTTNLLIPCEKSSRDVLLWINDFSISVY